MAAAAINSLTLSPSSSVKPSTSRLPHHFTLTPTRTRHLRCRIRATGPDILGDIGARDPFPAELESNFGEKVLGNMSTEHKILIPNVSALSLSQQTCSRISPHDPPMPQEEAKQLLLKVVGWRLIEEEEEDGKTVLKLRCMWKLRDFQCGAELIARIARVAQEAGHFPVMHLERNNQVRAELWTDEIGGLSLNDFIVAAKIDEVKTSDLVPRKRVWA
uniref:4a-hydroxytetrahydrobiopterin dehydratase n=1 Tax=Opuntia streptacantha TaxID=393608 RepID=A0A7C9DNN4_OPUST